MGNNTVNPLVIAGEGGVGYLVTALFTSGNPIAGALYGVVYAGSSYLLVEAFEWLGITGCSKVCDFVGKVFGSAAAATGVTIAFGFEITVPFGTVLAIAMTATHIVMKTLFVDFVKCK